MNLIFLTSKISLSRYAIYVMFKFIYLFYFKSMYKTELIM